MPILDVESLLGPPKREFYAVVIIYQDESAQELLEVNLGMLEKNRIYTHGSVREIKVKPMTQIGNTLCTNLHAVSGNEPLSSQNGLNTGWRKPLRVVTGEPQCVLAREPKWSPVVNAE
jgi:hypothetical protein